jgi:hypothetical protein
VKKPPTKLPSTYKPIPPSRALENVDPNTHSLVLKALAEGMSIRTVSRHYHLKPDTVRRARARAEASGQLQSLRDSIRSLTGEVALEGFSQLRDALYAGKLKPGQLPVLSAIALDKHQLLSDAPTAIVSVRKELSPEAIRAGLDRLLEGMPSANPPPAVQIDYPGDYVEQPPAQPPATTEDPSDAI